MVVWEASKFVPLHWCTKQPVYVANKIKTNYTGYFWSHTSGRTNVNHFTSTHMDSYPITLLSLEMIQKLLNELKDKHKQEVWHCSLILWSITERPGRYCTNSWTPNPRTRGAWPPPWLSHPTKCLARVAQTHGRLALWGGSRSSCASLPLLPSALPECGAKQEKFTRIKIQERRPNSLGGKTQKRCWGGCSYLLRKQGSQERPRPRGWACAREGGGTAAGVPGKSQAPNSCSGFTMNAQ